MPKFKQLSNHLLLIYALSYDKNFGIHYGHLNWILKSEDMERTLATEIRNAQT